MRDQTLHPHPHFLIEPPASAHSRFRDMIPADAVPNHHVERRRRRAFLAVALDADAVEARPPEQQALQLVRVTMVVEVDGAVGREERVEGCLVEGMRMRP